MTTAGVTTRVEAALATYASVVDQLQAVDQETLSTDEVLELLRGIETQQRRLAPVQHTATGQLERRSTAFELGAKNTAALLGLTLRISHAEAAGRVKAARRLAARRTVSGLLLEPEYPLVAAAQADGSISAAHARTITNVIAGLPIQVLDTPRNEDCGAGDGTAEFPEARTIGDWLEHHLIGQARMTDPQQLGRHARQLCAALDQDGVLREYEHRDRMRCLDLHVRTDGTSTLRSELTAEATERLLTNLDVLARPTPTEPDGGGEPIPDPRTPTQRRHDALLAMLRLVERAELLGDCAGVAATLVLTMDADVYATSTSEHSTGLATTGHGYQIPAGKARTWLSAESKVIAVLLSKTRGITGYSTSQRLATEQQRLALHARDHGCISPGCDTALLWTEAHHITDWKITGHTRVDDLTLLCPTHHRHLFDAGYTITMINGRPWVIPPPWIDPEQTPVRNTLYD